MSSDIEPNGVTPMTEVSHEAPERAAVPEDVTAKLAEWCKDIANYRDSAVPAGKALYHLKKNDSFKLLNYKSWDAFCDGILHNSPQYANRLIFAAKIYVEMETIVSDFDLPKSESHLRALGKVENPQERVDLFRGILAESSASGKPITAAVIRSAVEQRSGAQASTPARSTRGEARKQLEQIAMELKETCDAGMDCKALVDSLLQALKLEYKATPRTGEQPQTAYLEKAA